LAGDDATVSNRQRFPVFHLDEDSSQAQPLVLDKEWHDVGQLRLLLLAIGETGNALIQYQSQTLLRVRVRASSG
jgi:hypothetical protein